MADYDLQYKVTSRREGKEPQPAVTQKTVEANTITHLNKLSPSSCLSTILPTQLAKFNDGYWKWLQSGACNIPAIIQTLGMCNVELFTTPEICEL